MENFTKIIVESAGLLSALGVIIGVFAKFYNLIKGIKNKLDAMDEHTTENYIATLRLTIMSEEMPLEERIAAGDKYIRLGGNGAVKHKYEQLLLQLDRRKSQ